MSLPFLLLEFLWKMMLHIPGITHHQQIIVSNNNLTLLANKHDSRRRCSAQLKLKKKVPQFLQSIVEKLLCSMNQLYNTIHRRISKTQRIKHGIKKGILGKSDILGK